MSKLEMCAREASQKPAVFFICNHAATLLLFLKKVQAVKGVNCQQSEQTIFFFFTSDFFKFRRIVPFLHFSGKMSDFTEFPGITLDIPEPQISLIFPVFPPRRLGFDSRYRNQCFAGFFEGSVTHYQ